MTLNVHRMWFKVAAIVVGAFGPVFFLAATGIVEPGRWTLDVLSWPVDGARAYDAPTTRFLSALTGGFLLRWGVTIWCIGAYLHPVAPESARKTVLVGPLAWFALDSAGSLASGNASNVGFNLIVLPTAVGQLWQPAR